MTHGFWNPLFKTNVLFRRKYYYANISDVSGLHKITAHQTGSKMRFLLEDTHLLLSH